MLVKVPKLGKNQLLRNLLILSPNHIKHIARRKQRLMVPFIFFGALRFQLDHHFFDEFILLLVLFVLVN